MISRRTWRIRMTVAAKSDIQNILVWTSGHFGRRQARIYADTLRQAIRALTEGPDLLGSRKRNDIGEDIRILHVARGGRRGRHFVLYRANSRVDPPTIDVLRLLHDSMDLPRHVGSSGDQVD